jgi:DNA polymerase (family 10)
VTTKDPAGVIKHFIAYPDISKVVSKGPTRSTVILFNGMQVDLRVVAERCFGAALHYFTGSKAHNIKIRRLAMDQGLKINEYGVFRNGMAIAGKTEESVFKAVGLPPIPPELREDRGEINAAFNHALPELIQRKDLKGDLHSHTSATDGHAGIRAMAVAARKAGLDYLAITDHTRRLTVAHGLSADRLLKQIDEIDELNAELRGITLLKGTEVDILEDGTLDLPDPVLARLDLVVAAVHSGLNLPRKKQTERLLKAMDNRYFTILAHPSGRLMFSREPVDVDMEKIIQGAARRGCFLELNSQPLRLDLNDVHCRLAKDAGVLISINSDAHDEGGFGNLAYGIEQARRGWLEKQDVLNTRPLKSLRPLLRRTMA